MKYSKRIMEQAILICQISASDDHAITVSADLLGEEVGSEATWLASMARVAVTLAPWFQHDSVDLDAYGHECAEAECLLRDGWLPGDPLVVLRRVP